MKNRKHLEKTLEKIGLSEKEADVYLASLALGPSRVSEIARDSKVKRSTVYAIIEELRQKGLMRIELDGIKNVFVPESPSQLEGILESQKKELQKVLPELNSLYNFEGAGSMIKYYDTPEGIQNVCREILSEIRSGEDYFVVGDPERYDNANVEFFKDFIKKRTRVNLNAKILLTNSDLAREYKKYEKNFGEEVKILPKGITLDTNLTITKKKVVIQQIVDPLVNIVIENKSIVALQATLFKLLWDKY